MWIWFFLFVFGYFQLAVFVQRSGWIPIHHLYIYIYTSIFVKKMLNIFINYDIVFKTMVKSRHLEHRLPKPPGSGYWWRGRWKILPPKRRCGSDGRRRCWRWKLGWEIMDQNMELLWSVLWSEIHRTKVRYGNHYPIIIFPQTWRLRGNPRSKWRL